MIRCKTILDSLLQAKGPSLSPDQRAEIDKMLKAEEITNGQKMFDLFEEKVKDIRLKFASN